ncbi:MAG: hypothetical protein Q7S21_02770 [archaeon]|nr:hypothetical protein [archaeon]
MVSRKKKKYPSADEVIAKIREARKNPEFMAFIREFVKYHTGPKNSK